MKSKFKSAFGAEFETFFDSDATAAADDETEKKVKSRNEKFNEVVQVEDHQSLLFENSVDDKVLESLIAANNKIDKLS